MNCPLRVLHLLHDSRRSGVPAVVFGLLTSFDRGMVVPSAFFAYDGVYAEDLRKAGIEVLVFAGRLPFLWRLNRFLAVFLLPFLLRRYDVVHAHSIKMAPMALAAKLLGARVVFHLHEKAGKKGRLLRMVLACVDRVVFCAENCAAHYSDLQVRSSETILNAIRVPHGQAPPRERRERKIVMLGSINRNKGQDLLLRAFAALRPAGFGLWLYGTIGLSAHGFVRSLRRGIASSGLDGAVFMPGPTAEAERVLREAYLLVHASLNECLSISVLEAMAHGVPVIANDIPGMSEVIDDGVNGFLVPAGDIDALAGRMALLLEHPDVWDKVAAAGRATLEERFDMSIRALDFIRVYRELVGCGTDSAS